jgi:outer membrane immunogenic protein
MRHASLAVIYAVSGIAFAQVASAADLPLKAPPRAAAPAVFSWTGCYVGANLGGGWTKHHLATDAPPFPPNLINDTARTAINNAGLASLSHGGITGGGQVGCNWQPTTAGWSSLVLGIEGDLNGIDGDVSRNTGNVVEPVSGRTVRSIDDIGVSWFATVRGRIGWAFDRLMIYGTGGAAFANVDASKRFAWDFTDGCPVVNGLNECHVGRSSSTRIGWTAGGGVEWAFRDHWSAKAEYLYADLGDVSYSTFNNAPGFAPPGQVANHTVSTKLQVVRVGVNYRF